MRASYLACVALVLVAAALGVLAVLRPDTPLSLAQWQQGAAVRAGYAIEAPFSYVDREGRVSGEAPEMLRRALGRLGIQQISWRHAEFGELINELEAGRLDVVASGLFITPERRARVCFTRPTVAVVGGLLVRNGNPLNLHALREVVDNPTARVAAIAGSIEAERMRKAGLPPERLLVFPQAQDALASLRAGRADVLSLSEPSLRQMLKDFDAHGFELAQPYEAAPPGDPGEPGWPALAFRADLHEACAAADASVGEVLADPAYERSIERFGFRPEDVATARAWTPSPR